MPRRLLVLTLLAAAGCGSADDVQTYKVPQPVEVPAEELTGEYQILGAYFPDDEPAWFFKFAGKAADLAPYTADFEKMMASVRFPNGGLKNQPVWDTPAGWTTGEGRGDIVLATVKPDAKRPDLEVTLTAARGGAFANVKRWAGQLGQANFNNGQMAGVTKPIPTKVPGTFVNLRGPKSPAAGPMMMGNPHK